MSGKIHAIVRTNEALSIEKLLILAVDINLCAKVSLKFSTAQMQWN